MPEQTSIQPEMGQGAVLVAETTQDTPKARKRPRFDLNDVQAMAQLIAKGCNETEACKLLNRRAESWLNWKLKPRNKKRFEDALHEVKGQIVVTCINGIEKAGLKDWRALRERLALLDRDRFSDKASPGPVQINVGVFSQCDIPALAAKVFGQLQPKPEPKQIGPSSDPA